MTLPSIQTENKTIGLLELDLAPKLAAELGLDQVSFDSCLDEGKYTQAAQDDLALARKADIGGTPTFVINKTKLVGAQPIAAFKAILDQEL